MKFKSFNSDLRDKIIILPSSGRMDLLVGGALLYLLTLIALKFLGVTNVIAMGKMSNGQAL